MHLFDHVAVSPSIGATSASGGTTSGTASNASVARLGIGAQATYYFASNFYLSGTLGLSRLSFDNGSGTSTSADTGFALRAAAGYEWWVSDHWGLGVAAQVSGASNGDSTTAGTPSITTTAFTLAFSATWN